MDYFGKYHIFRDPVHGFIKVYEIERDLINTRAFQRLRRIKQLALTHYVYHGATHTRFGHSLGVMEIATRIFDIVIHKDRYGDKILDWAANKNEVEKRRILLRLVALLHDIGHAPFSHVGEKLMPKDTSHELMAAALVREDTEFGHILDRIEVVKREDIALFFEGKKPDPLVQQICMGPLDADKIDYLIRDSHYTGVHYGRFDSDRLIHMMAVVEDQLNQDPTLGIEEGGVHAAEAMALARFYMFQQVYFHKTRRIYDLHLENFLRANLPDGTLPNDVCSFCRYDDAYFEKLLEEQASSIGIDNRTVQALARRKHFRLVHCTTDYPDNHEKDRFRLNLEKLKTRYPDILEDNVTNASNKWDKLGSYICVRQKDERIWDEIVRRGSLIGRLEPVQISRIYSPRELFDDVNRECQGMNWSKR